MKKCNKCGASIPDDSKFCPNCGASQGTSQNNDASLDNHEDSKPDLSDYGPHNSNGDPVGYNAPNDPPKEKPSVDDYGPLGGGDNYSEKPRFSNDPVYNQPSDQERYNDAMMANRAHTYAILAIVFGGLGGWLGLLFGILGLTATKNKTDRILCWVGIILWILWLVADVVVSAVWARYLLGDGAGASSIRLLINLLKGLK